MIRGIFAGTSALRMQMTRMTMMANNLVNAGTPGYKQDLTSVGRFPQLMLSRVVDGGRSAGSIGTVGTGAGVRESIIDLNQGDLADSQHELDMAIIGPGFFVVETPDGPRYTRDGSFNRAPDGTLVSADGHPVLGEGGPIVLPLGEVSVYSDGSIEVDDAAVGRLQIVDFPPEARFEKLGNNLLFAEGATPLEDRTVRQFTLELSNVDSVQAMIELMAASRAYETSQRLIQIQDQTLERAVNDVGRL